MGAINPFRSKEAGGGLEGGGGGGEGIPAHSADMINSGKSAAE